MENELEKKKKFSQLLLLYGKLLTKNISSRLEMFYWDDYSISEIAEIEKVSRNAVFESLNHGEKQLEKYESKLNLSKKYQLVLKDLDELVDEKDAVKRKEIIEEIKGELGYGI